MSADTPRIGLDIDGVIANFPAGVIRAARDRGLGPHFPSCCHYVTYWDMSPMLTDVMRDLWEDPEFWLELEPMADPSQIDFHVEKYITSRPISSAVTEQWLAKHGFPQAPVITCSASDKVDHADGLDLFVDDYFVTVDHMLSRGVPAVLFAAPYQRGHQVDHLPTIKRLSDVNLYVDNLRLNAWHRIKET